MACSSPRGPPIPPATWARNPLGLPFPHPCSLCSAGWWLLAVPEWADVVSRLFLNGKGWYVWTSESDCKNLGSIQSTPSLCTGPSARHRPLPLTALHDALSHGGWRMCGRVQRGSSRPTGATSASPTATPSSDGPPPPATTTASSSSPPPASPNALLHPRTALAHRMLLVAGTPVSEVGLGFGSLPYSGVTYFDVQKIKPDPKVFEVPSFCPK